MSTPNEWLADIQRWTEKQKDLMVYIVRDAAFEVFSRATQRQPSVKETGGSFEVGKVPVDTGFLIGTSEIRVGAQASRGAVGGSGSSPPDFAAALAGHQPGEDIVFVYTAPYARRLEYGFSGADSLGRIYNQAGRFFIRTAISDWDAIVQDSAAKFRNV